VIAQTIKYQVMKFHRIIGIVLFVVVGHLFSFAQAGLGLRNLEYRTPVTGLFEIDTMEVNHDFTFGLHYRWFDSAIPYSGNLRQDGLEAENLHDIFNIHSGNITIGYSYNRRWSAFLAVPLQFGQKSSVLEHSLVNGSFVARQRRVTEAAGLGDMILMVNYAAILPTHNRKSYLTVGLGAKLPTGSSTAMDIWHNVGPNRTSVLRPVDPVIQPGDGNWGLMVDLRGGFRLLDWIGVYGEGRYLSTPTPVNGTPTFRDTFSEEFSEEGTTSVSDQYMVRGGITLAVPQSPVLFSFGIRVDGTPVNDLIGSSQGFRRPGYATSFESNVVIQSSKMNFYVSLPYIYYQQRDQSNPDIAFSSRTGRFRQGDAPFARFALFVGVSSKI